MTERQHLHASLASRGGKAGEGEVRKACSGLGEGNYRFEHEPKLGGKHQNHPEPSAKLSYRSEAIPSSDQH